MRIVYTNNDQKKTSLLSTFLASEGIENQLEISTNSDWGSTNYGDITCRIWVIDEDRLESALRWIDTFEKEPNHPIFKKTVQEVPPLITPVSEPGKKPPPLLPRPTQVMDPIVRTPMGKITLVFLLICTALFIITEFTAPIVTLKSLPASIPATPLFTSPVKKSMLYDYPEAYQLIDKIIALYGVDSLQTPQDLPSEGQYLLKKFQQTPYWQGFYATLIHQLNPSKAIPPSQPAPLFEKIRQGEIWRAFTPCLLHSDILHILFNMLWLFVLGNQMELRLGNVRYLIFAFAVGIFSNTCQYMMSGANFIGFSGILCGMLTFIWMRQKVAPWEGYPLQKSTITFMLFFILAMFSMQAISFFLEYDQQLSISPGIANTAHLSGAALGIILGRLPFFSWKT